MRTRHPVHLTWRVEPDLPNLRGSSLFAVLCQAFEGGRDRFGFRLVHFTVQSNHLHLIAEDEHALSRGMQGLGVRIAKALSKWLGRCGRVLGDRYHARQLRTPREVRNALRHGVRCALPDPCSSGAAFDGWAVALERAAVSRSAPVCRARSWLLRIGWRRRGLIAPDEVPAAAG